MARRINPSNLPIRFPGGFWIAIYLLMKDLHAPSWLYGSVWVLLTLSLIATIVSWIRDEYIDVIEVKK